MSIALESGSHGMMHPGPGFGGMYGPPSVLSGGPGPGLWPPEGVFRPAPPPRSVANVSFHGSIGSNIGGGESPRTVFVRPDGNVPLLVNIRCRGQRTLLVQEAIHVSVPDYSTMKEVWRAIKYVDSDTLHKYNKRLTGRVHAVDTFRENSWSLCMQDPVAKLVGTPFVTVVFIVEQSVLSQIYDAGVATVNRFIEGARYDPVLSSWDTRYYDQWKNYQKRRRRSRSVAGD